MKRKYIGDSQSDIEKIKRKKAFIFRFRITQKKVRK